MKPVPTWFIAVSWVMAVGFCICVGLQINDPDPLEWMALYGAAAIACALLPARRIVVAGAVAIGLLAAGWAAYLAHQVRDVLVPSDLWMRMSEKGGAVEVGREAAGLAVVALALLMLAGFRSLRA